MVSILGRLDQTQPTRARATHDSATCERCGVGVGVGAKLTIMHGYCQLESRRDRIIWLLTGCRCLAKEEGLLLSNPSSCVVSHRSQFHNVGVGGMSLQIQTQTAQLVYARHGRRHGYACLGTPPCATNTR